MLGADDQPPNEAAFSLQFFVVGLLAAAAGMLVGAVSASLLDIERWAALLVAVMTGVISTLAVGVSVVVRAGHRE